MLFIVGRDKAHVTHIYLLRDHSFFLIEEETIHVKWKIVYVTNVKDCHISV